MKKRFKILLIVSLCLNILLIGFIAGEVRHFGPRSEVSQTIKKFMVENEEQQRQINQERKRALNMLGQDNFDPKAYADQVVKISQLQSAMFQKLALEMGEKIRAMPQAERDTLLTRLKERHATSRHAPAASSTPATPSAPATPAAK